MINVINEGYKLPLKNIPKDVFLDNNKTVKDNDVFVMDEIQNLSAKGCISEVFSKPHVGNPLTVAHNKNGKKKLVLDCRHVNPHLFQFKFKYEDSSTARKIIEKGDFGFTFDLKSAYHPILIFLLP